VAHQRNRYLFPIILRKRTLWPVLGVLGPRQTGKSTLLRDQVTPKIDARYISFDRGEHRKRAEKSPDYFLSTIAGADQPLIIDEVQKVPEIFDAVKAAVDERRRPGRFLLTGSTEFSRKTGIRESLTGRIGLLHLYPLTVRETNERAFAAPWVTGKPLGGVSPAELNIWLERGGMPGICFLRDAGERNALFQGYLDTSCFRDLQQVVGGKLSGDLALEIMHLMVQLERPNASEIGAKLRADTRRVKRHLEALEALFLIHRLEPHRSGIGKDLFLPFDAGLALHLGAPPAARLKIWAINECLAQHEYAGRPRPKLRYYESSKHSLMDLVLEAGGKITGILLTDEAVPTPYLLRTAVAFRKRLPEVEVRVLAPTSEMHREAKGISVIPWTMMA